VRLLDFFQLEIKNWSIVINLQEQCCPKNFRIGPGHSQHEPGSSSMPCHRQSQWAALAPGPFTNSKFSIINFQTGGRFRKKSKMLTWVDHDSIAYHDQAAVAFAFLTDWHNSRDLPGPEGV
jgi:hypothetical protein